MLNKLKTLNKYELIGYLGTAMFSLCGLPQAIHSIRVGNSDGITWGFILLWLGGEICHTLYVIGAIEQVRQKLPLLINYGFNILLILIILYYKF